MDFRQREVSVDEPESGEDPIRALHQSLRLVENSLRLAACDDDLGSSLTKPPVRKWPKSHGTLSCSGFVTPGFYVFEKFAAIPVASHIWLSSSLRIHIFMELQL